MECPGVKRMLRPRADILCCAHQTSRHFHMMYLCPEQINQWRGQCYAQRPSVQRMGASTGPHLCAIHGRRSTKTTQMRTTKQEEEYSSSQNVPQIIGQRIQYDSNVGENMSNQKERERGVKIKVTVDLKKPGSFKSSDKPTFHSRQDHESVNISKTSPGHVDPWTSTEQEKKFGLKIEEESNTEEETAMDSFSDRGGECILQTVPGEVTVAASSFSENQEEEQETRRNSPNLAEHVIGVVDQVIDLPNQVVEQATQVADQVKNIRQKVVDPVSNLVSLLKSEEGTEDDDDDEFEAYETSDSPEFKGHEGVRNFTVLQEDRGILASLYNMYSFMVRKPIPQFAMGVFLAPILVSSIFTLFYLPEFHDLALNETVKEVVEASGVSADVGPSGAHLSWCTVFEVFMFSLSLSTGLQQELAPLSPYTLVLANINALVAQLVFVFLSGAVFARLSQPPQPIRFSTIALVCPPARNCRKRSKGTGYSVLIARYVLVGPQPCELVDVKVELTYRYNTVTRTGAFFRVAHPLKLVRSEMAYLNHGMLVRHVIDETSLLYNRTPETLLKEDAIFTLSVVGLERSSMQSIFHVQNYCVFDGDVIWNAEFEDMILINKRNKRIVDHSRLSQWRAVEQSSSIER